MTGVFITFEGGEGSGKSTQIKRLAEMLQKKGQEIVLTREPGGTFGAETIRKLLVEGTSDSWSPMAETLLFYAARMDHVERVIKPALAAGKVVLCDRFADSTIVYQGIAKKLGVEFVKNLHKQVLGDFKPHKTLLLDIAPEIGLGRAKARAGAEIRYENMDLSFHEAIRQGFLDLAKAEPNRITVIDASKNLEDVASSIQSALQQAL